MAVFRRRTPSDATARSVRVGGRRAGSSPADFATIYDAYFPPVLGYCMSQLGDREMAEDAASQTFLKALAAYPAYQETGQIRAWLFAIAHRVLIDIHRDRRPAEPLERAAEVPDPASSPEERAIRQLDAAWLDAALTRLPPDDRQILELRRAGLTGREIADVLEISHEAAKKRQLRAINRLRAELLDGHQDQEVLHGA